MSSENELSMADPVPPTTSSPPDADPAPLPEVNSDKPDMNDSHAEAGVGATDAQTSEPSLDPDPNTDETLGGNDTTQTQGEAGEVDANANTADGDDGASTAVAGTLSGSSKKNNQRRKSAGGVPEHKSKKLNKKKSEPQLHVDAKPGDYFFARLKGYPPWPAIICDEEMLPETMLQNRPVSTKRPDGSYRADYDEGGKNYKERTFPVMFLHTNEFQFIPNYQLTPLDPTEISSQTPGKKTKQLQQAYEVAAEANELDHFKRLLYEHEQAVQEEMQAIAERERKKKEKQETKEKKPSRKSKGGDEDVEMGDAEDDVGEKKAKSSKKRKNEGEEGDSSKPAKTPKTKLKVTLSNKTPNGDSSAKSSAKAKTKTSTSKPKPQISEPERLENRRKEVFYFRHMLQKGFLTTDHEPDADTLKQLSDFIKSLETNYKDLEVGIIRQTKINKVLKAIIRLTTIPSDEQYNFRKRSLDLLDHWQKSMSDEPHSSKAAKAEASNGVDKEKKPLVEPSVEGEVPETPVVADSIEKQADDADMVDAPAKAEDPVEPVDTPVEATLPGNEAQDEADTGVADAEAEAEEPSKVVVVEQTAVAPTVVEEPVVEKTEAAPSMETV